MTVSITANFDGEVFEAGKEVSGKLVLIIEQRKKPLRVSKFTVDLFAHVLGTWRGNCCCFHHTRVRERKGVGVVINVGKTFYGEGLHEIPFRISLPANLAGSFTQEMDGSRVSLIYRLQLKAVLTSWFQRNISATVPIIVTDSDTTDEELELAAASSRVQSSLDQGCCIPDGRITLETNLSRNVFFANKDKTIDIDICCLENESSSLDITHIDVGVFNWLTMRESRWSFLSPNGINAFEAFKLASSRRFKLLLKPGEGLQRPLTLSCPIPASVWKTINAKRICSFVMIDVRVGFVGNRKDGVRVSSQIVIR